MKRKLKLFVLILTIIFMIIYIFYRMFFTIPLNSGVVSLIFSIVLLALEIWCFIDFFIYFLNTLSLEKKKVEISDLNSFSNIPNVDILIATYNESEDILTNTIKGCLNLDYPDSSLVHIYLCDDGNRKDIKKMCKELNVNYISRTSRKNFKAGNYNNALNHTNSPYIVTFDADMVPSSDFLLITIPLFLENENLGFVQSPQSFINPDIYQYRFYLENDLPFEQENFYSNTQLYNNSINSTVCCGTNVVFSRQALLDAGGFARDSISEDIATGLLIQSKGYHCIAISDIIAHGISVQDYDGFIKQRSRWAIGSVQMFKNYNIFKQKGLSLRQKLQYLSYVSYWFFGLKRLLFIISPLLFSLFNIILIDTNMYVFAFIWLLMYVFKKLAISIFSGDAFLSTWNTIHETILCPALCFKVLKSFFSKKTVNFDVSPKDVKKSKFTFLNMKILIVHIVLLVLNLLALVTSGIKFSNNTTIINYIFSVIWIFYNIFYLLISIIFDINNRTDKVDNFIPNKVTKYSLKSILKIFKFK